MSFRILIPCMAFTVRVEVYGSDKPTLFEQALLKFLWAAEEASLDEIVDFLGLGKAIALDILLELWNRRWTEVNLVSDRVKLVTDVRRRVENDDFSNMKGADNAIELKFIFDLIEGKVVPLVHEAALRGPGGPAYTCPKLPRAPGKTGRFEMALDGYLQASNGELLRALKMHPIYPRIAGDDLSDLQISIPTPEADVEPRHVRYVGVFFDPVVTEDETLELKVNDDRPELRFLGQELQETIVDRLDDGSPLLAALKDSATRRTTVSPEQSPPLSSFLHQVGDLTGWANNPEADIGTGELERLRDLWGKARGWITTLAERRADPGGAAQAHAGRAAVDKALRAALTQSAGALVLTSPEIDPQYLAEGDPTVLHQIEQLHAAGSRNLYIQTSTSIAKRARDALAVLGDNPGTAYSERPPGSVRTRSSLVLFDGNKLMISSEPLLKDSSEMAITISYRPRNLGLGANALQDLLDRLSKDFALDLEAGQRLRGETFGAASAAAERAEEPDETGRSFQSLLAAIDDLVGRLPRADDPDTEAGESTALRLMLRELGQHVAELDHWVRAESQGADLLFDSDIFDEVLELVRSTPTDHPLAIGLSSRRDLGGSAVLLGAIARRAAASGAPVFLHLPGDKRLEEHVLELSRRFDGSNRIKVLTSRPGTRWGFGFAMAPGRCILAAEGVAYRLRNVGRNRPGTVIGLSLYGADLCERAREVLAQAHDFSQFLKRIPENWDAPVQKSDELLAVFETWQAQPQAAFDGNAGVNTVRPHMHGEVPVPWRPDDPSLRTSPPDLKYALLKAAAAIERDDGGNREAYGGALRAYAAQCLRDGRLGHAAILAEHLRDGTIAQSLVRTLLLAWACGTPFRLGEQEVPREFARPQEREAFLLLVTLLALDGLAEELLPWLTGPHPTFGFLDLPLDRLARSALDWTAANPGGSYAAQAVREAGEPEEVGKVWERATASFENWRTKAHKSLSVRAVRDLVFDGADEPLADVGRLFRKSNRNPTPEVFREFLEIVRNHAAFGRGDEILHRAKRDKMAHDYYSSACDRAGGNIVGAGRKAYEHHTSAAFDLVAELIRALRRDAPKARAESALAAAAREFEHAATAADTRGRNGEATAQLTEALLQRLGADASPTWRLRPWMLPTAPLDQVNPDWAVLQSALIRCELPDASDEGLTRTIKCLLEGGAGWSAAAIGEDPVRVAYALLRRCEALGGNVTDPELLDRAGAEFVGTLSRQAASLIQEIAALRASKHRAGIDDASFEGKAISALDALTGLRGELAENGAALDDEQIGCLGRKRETASRLRSELAAMLANKEQEVLEGIERDSPLHAWLREVLDRRLFDLARHIKAVETGKADGQTAGTLGSGDSVAAFSDLVFGSSSLDAMHRDLEEFCLQRGLDGTDAAFINILGAAMLEALEGREPSSGPGKFFAALRAYLGAEAEESDRIETVEGMWILHSASPAMIALAPYLAQRQNGCRRLAIAIPWTRDSLERLDRVFSSDGGGWRTTVFPDDDGAPPEDTPEDMRSLGSLDRLMEKTGVRDGAAAARSGQVPLVLSLLSRQYQTSLPHFTHASLVVSCDRPRARRSMSIARHLAGQVSPRELRRWWNRPDDDRSGSKPERMAVILGSPAEAPPQRNRPAGIPRCGGAPARRGHAPRCRPAGRRAAGGRQSPFRQGTGVLRGAQPAQRAGSALCCPDPARAPRRPVAAERAGGCRRSGPSGPLAGQLSPVRPSARPAWAPAAFSRAPRARRHSNSGACTGRRGHARGRVSRRPIHAGQPDRASRR